MPRIKTISMRYKILLSCIGCVIVALVLQAVLFQQSSSNVIYSQAQEISRTTMNNLQDELYAFHKTIENSLIKIYNENEFIRDLSQMQAVENPKYAQLAFELARNAFVPSQSVVALYIYSSDSELISSHRHAYTPRHNYPVNIFSNNAGEETLGVEEFVASDERVMLITSYYHASRELRIIRYVLKVYRNATDFIGFIVCDVDPSPLGRILDKHRYTSGQIIWLQPDNDKVAVSSGQQDYNQNPMFLSIAENIEHDMHISDTRNFESGYELFSVRSHKYNFTAHSLVPQTALRLNEITVRNNTIFIFIAILFLVSFVFTIISNNLTKPLNYVIDTMSRIKSGDMELRLKKMRNDEIGRLGQEFNDMLDEAERLIKAQYETQMLVNDAKYKALQAQVNPHFLYNTLNTMSSISMSQNSPTVSTLCKALSNIFRYSLDMNEPYATLESEILHIKNYMYVMNVRMSNSIQIVFDVDSSLLQEKIPRLSIQPLVENAVNHGLKNKSGEKEVIIGAKREDGFLTVYVEDNGIGVDADKINERMTHSVMDALEKSTSIGLDNINARLKLLYGDEYGVFAESGTRAGSRISMRRPL